MPENDGKLVVLWTSGDPEVAREMVLMYTLNAKLRRWWDEVTLVVWGPSQKLLVGDPELQERLRKASAAGVRLEACLACAEDYGVTEALKGLGIDVRFMGVPLTEYLKAGIHVLTF